ncbi:hypothetical protein [Nocardioides pocheonensis]|uniref:Uncharacterized protein n=1 Tax=Nocardioides pocheonensis TaxID=661485 RepID=A0A3N0GKJ7_9ACTN|nr:hypothetical protein [Nocardioides pocheonensis]RNM13007.1 hypothetical protein EFL26_16380 [Nocardioides pocheonensis]
MGFDLSDLAGLLNMGPPAGEAWFEQTESIVGFAPQKPTAKRPIILRHWPDSGAIAYVFARTSNLDRVEVNNPGHDHRQEWPKCWLRDVGSIVVSRPLPVPKDALDEPHRLCSESDQLTIDAVKRARWQTK